MNTIELIKAIDFERYRQARETIVNNRLNDLHDHTEKAKFVTSILQEILECAVKDGYIKREDLDGLKEFEIRETFTFYFRVDARDEEHANELATKATGDRYPVYEVDVDGYRQVIDGDFVERDIDEVR